MTRTHDSSHDTGLVTEGPTVLQAAWRYRWPVVALTLLGLLAGLAFSLSRPSESVASARLVLSDPWGADLSLPDRPVGGDFERFLRSQVRFVTSDEVLGRAAETLGTDPGTLDDHVDASAEGAGDILVITATGDDDAEAEARLDAVVDAYGEERQALIDRQIEDAIAGIEAEVATPDGAFNPELADRAAELRVAASTYGDGIAFIERTDTEPSRGLIATALPPIAGAAFGLAIGLAIAWIASDRRPEVSDPASPAERYDTTLLGVLDDRSDADALWTSYELALLTIAHHLTDTGPSGSDEARVLAVTPVDDSVSVTTIAENLGAVARASGARVLVHDASELGRLRTAGTAPLPATEGYDLVLFACPPAETNGAVLRLGWDIQGIVLVVPEKVDAGAADRTVSLISSVGLSILGYLYVRGGRRLHRSLAQEPVA